MPCIMITARVSLKNNALKKRIRSSDPSIEYDGPNEECLGKSCLRCSLHDKTLPHPWNLHSDHGRSSIHIWTTFSGISVFNPGNFLFEQELRHEELLTAWRLMWTIWVEEEIISLRPASSTFRFRDLRWDTKHHDSSNRFSLANTSKGSDIAVFSSVYWSRASRCLFTVTILAELQTTHKSCNYGVAVKVIGTKTAAVIVNTMKMDLLQASGPLSVPLGQSIWRGWNVARVKMIDPSSF